MHEALRREAGTKRAYVSLCSDPYRSDGTALTQASYKFSGSLPTLDQRLDFQRKPAPVVFL